MEVSVLFYFDLGLFLVAGEHFIPEDGCGDTGDKVDAARPREGAANCEGRDSELQRQGGLGSTLSAAASQYLLCITVRLSSHTYVTSLQPGMVEATSLSCTHHTSHIGCLANDHLVSIQVRLVLI